MFGGLDSIMAAGLVESPDPDDVEEFAMSIDKAICNYSGTYFAMSASLFLLICIIHAFLLFRINPSHSYMHT